MNEQLSDRINRLAESQTIAMAQKSRELQAQGHDIINLSLGEPDFNTPDFVKDAAKEAIDNNFTKYMPVPGYQDLREAISKKFKRDNGLDYSPEQIVVSTGAKQSITNIVLSLIDPGDEVLLPVPYWVTYHEIIKLAGGIPVKIPSGIETNFKVSGKQLEKYITDKTKLLVFSTPCNPSGSVYSKEELEDIAKTIAAKDNIYILSDEIYELINFSGGHQSMAQFDFIYDRTITVNGVSKAFAMTGWRVGYIGAPQWIAKACIKMQGQFTSGTCGIAQKAAKAAVSADPAVCSHMRDAFKTRRDLVIRQLNGIPGIKNNEPEGAFYIFPDISSFFGKSGDGTVIRNADDLAMYLLMKANVAVVTGAAFGAPDCIRISYAASTEQLKEAMNRIKVALGKLK